ncbi:MAG: Rrf2 family transcriptional regulator [Deltaproteobacteria bacterium]|nr:Rrf2 family transcriptional regulator [Deltaproteobacteria bacterium]
MRLSARAHYALRLMHEITQLGGTRQPVQLTQVARLTGISRRYLEQLVLALKSHALLRGVCGRNGGYLLARPASQITVGAVVEAAIGPINLSVCVGQPETCLRSDFCECRLVWLLLDQRIHEVLAEYSVADLGNKPLLSAIRMQLQATHQATRARRENSI